MKRDKFIIGTRGSQLAQIYTEKVINHLNKVSFTVKKYCDLESGKVKDLVHAFLAILGVSLKLGICLRWRHNTHTLA